MAEEINLLGGISSLLGWDEKTKMPPKGATNRGRQSALLGRMRHERAIGDEMRRAVEAAEASDPDSPEVREMRRDFDISTKLPSDFVHEQIEASSNAHHAWKDARERNDFDLFAPDLKKLVDLARREADYLGFETEPWDALGDLYEEGMRAADLEPLFSAAREPILQLVDRQPEPDTSILRRSYPVDRQHEYAHHIVKAIGFDLAAGRIDTTTHPFCIGVGDGDVRLTTRYDEHWLPGSVFAAIHEAGHGIYNQAFSRLGLPKTIGEAPGLGMHESQSRMFENIVGRSRPFWEFHYGELQRYFPDALGGVELNTFLQQINVAEPTFIRVEADELTYNLHIGLRFELERGLVDGSLKVRDLPEAWNEASERWLGIRPASFADGCLQDIHWSMGSFGYFPTYFLGNVYSTAFCEKIRSEFDLDANLRRGDISQLMAWLDENIYRWGRVFTGFEFVERITGGPVSVDPLIRYLTARFG